MRASPLLAALVFALATLTVLGASAQASPRPIRTVPVVKHDEVLDPSNADGDILRAVAPTRLALDAELARLDALRRELRTETTDFCLEMSAQLVFGASVVTTLGALAEVIAQGLRSHPWENTTPEFLLGGGLVGAGMAAIGAPLLAACSSDHGYRRAERIGQRRRSLASRRAGMPDPEPAPPPPASYLSVRLDGFTLRF